MFACREAIILIMLIDAISISDTPSFCAHVAFSLGRSRFECFAAHIQMTAGNTLNPFTDNEKRPPTRCMAWQMPRSA